MYVAQAQGLQQRLQAEYESLQAADASDGDALLLEGATETTDNNGSTQENASSQSDSSLSGTEANTAEIASSSDIWLESVIVVSVSSSDSMFSETQLS